MVADGGCQRDLVSTANYRMPEMKPSGRSLWPWKVLQDFVGWEDRRSTSRTAPQMYLLPFQDAGHLDLDAHWKMSKHVAVLVSTRTREDSCEP